MGNKNIGHFFLNFSSQIVRIIAVCLIVIVIFCLINVSIFTSVPQLNACTFLAFILFSFSFGAVFFFLYEA